MVSSEHHFNIKHVSLQADLGNSPMYLFFYIHFIYETNIFTNSCLSKKFFYNFLPVTDRAYAKENG